MSEPLPQVEFMSDADLKRRTEALLQVAAEVSLELQAQTERLSLAIDLFNRDAAARAAEARGDARERPGK